MFFSDLVKELDLDLTTEFMILKSYTGTERSSEINVVQDLNRPIAGRHVLIVEDILDTGHTLHKIYDLLSTRTPASLQTAVMLHKVVVVPKPFTGGGGGGGGDDDDYAQQLE